MSNNEIYEQNKQILEKLKFIELKINMLMKYTNAETPNCSVLRLWEIKREDAEEECDD